jgi:hypothetical protein
MEIECDVSAMCGTHECMVSNPKILLGSSAVQLGIQGLWSYMPRDAEMPLTVAMQANPIAAADSPSGEAGVETGFNPLSLMLNNWAAKPAGEDVAITKLLLQHASKVPCGRAKLLNDRTSIMARTPLHIAVSLHDVRSAQKQQVVELLLAQPETDINAADALGALLLRYPSTSYVVVKNLPFFFHRWDGSTRKISQRSTDHSAGGTHLSFGTHLI